MDAWAVWLGLRQLREMRKEGLQMDEYLYCTIPYLGKAWTFQKKAEVKENGTIVTGVYSGYGDILDPNHEKNALAVTVPIIDLRDNWEAASAACSCPDELRPREEYPRCNGGTLDTYLEYIENAGGRVIRPQ
jgi:hypothetical protein